MSERKMWRAPLFFLLITVFVLPALAFCYAGFFTMNYEVDFFAALLTCLDLLNAFFFLVILAGILLMLSRFRRYYESKYEPLSPWLLRLLAVYKVLTLLLIPVTVCYSLLPQSKLAAFFWILFYAFLPVTGVLAACMMIYLGYVKKLRAVLFLGIVFLFVNLFDYNGFKFFENLMLDEMSLVSGEGSDVHIFGLSELDYEMLDMNTKEWIEEGLEISGLLMMVSAAAFVIVRIVSLSLFFSAFFFIVPKPPFSLPPSPSSEAQ
ncbi:MAG: hypothetical protein LBR60_05180 [Fibrobacter sp.]|jgi:hypothetical protein|nr:hypothetical protein [Fibrobacter sp.]